MIFLHVSSRCWLSLRGRKILRAHFNDYIYKSYNKIVKRAHFNDYIYKSYNKIVNTRWGLNCMLCTMLKSLQP